MRSISPRALFFVAVAFVCSNVFGQSSATDSQTRPRTVTQLAQQTVNQAVPQTSAPATAAPSNEAVTTESTNRTALQLTPPVIQARITEAERLLKSRPLSTSMTTPSIEFVTVAALDRATQKTHLITLSKETFLQKGSEISLPTSLGTLA